MMIRHKRGAHIESKRATLMHFTSLIQLNVRLM